jgi:TP901 family phage tail tape measure protein
VPLGARELLLAIEARDNASAAIRGVGTATQGLGTQSRFAGYQVFALGLALQKAGTMLENFGKAIFSAAGEVINLGKEFDYNMRLVQTQARLGETQLRNFEEAANDVMGSVAQSSTEISEGLYDIFSSVETNYKDAINMVTSFAHAATAGGTDVRTVTRGVIQIMNAFGLSADDTRGILDLLFKQVQQSTGTFEELISAWGNVVSAAKSMDQTLQTTAGAVDFLTKRGRTQAQATISVSRALDQLSRHFKDVQAVLGVPVFDKATGNFRQLNDIITDMGVAMKGFTTKEQVQAFEDMFGAGSIQANRFFRLAVPQFQQLNKNVAALTQKDLKGYFKGAWDIMRKTPAVQIEILRNRWESLQRDLRDVFIPILMDLVKMGKQVLDWVDGWSDSTKELAAKIILVVGALAVFFGAIGRISGGFLLFASLLKFAGLSVTTFASILGSLGLVGGVVVAALIGAAALIITHWEEFTDWWDRNWETIRTIAFVAIGAIIVLLGNLARAAAVNVGAKIINLGLAFETAGGSVGVFKTALAGLGRVVTRIGWAIFLGWVLDIAAGFASMGRTADKTFGILNRKGPAAVAGIEAKIRAANDAIQESHDHWWNFLAVWRAPEWARQAANFDGLTAGLERYRRKIWEATSFSDEFGGKLNILSENSAALDRITLKEARSLGSLFGMYRKVVGPMDATTVAAINNLLSFGDVEAVVRLLSGRIKDDLIPGLKNLLPQETAVAEKAADMGQKAAYAASKIRDAARAANGFNPKVGQLQAYADAFGILAREAGAAAEAIERAQRIAAGTGGGTGGGRRGGGGTGGGGTGGGTGGHSTGGGEVTGTTSLVVNVSPHKANLDSKDLTRELTWVLRSAEWM